MNRIIITGRLSQLPDFKTTQTGLSYCKISIAVDSNMPNKQTGKKDTYFFNAIAWGKQAEFINNYITKGQLVGVVGELKNRSWQNQDGTRAYTTEISIESIESFEKRQNFQTQQASSQTGVGVAVPPNPYTENTDTNLDYDPFSGEENG